MKKTMTTLAVLGLCAALPAFAADAQATSKSTYVEKVTYHTVQRPLTSEEVAERQQMGTKIAETINRVDTDNDHQLNRAEWSYSAKLFNISSSSDTNDSFYRVDTNHDGQLSSQELLKAELAEKEAAMPTIAPASGNNVRIIEKQTTIVR